jgi:hypothetical protein
MKQERRVQGSDWNSKAGLVRTVSVQDCCSTCVGASVQGCNRIASRQG